jgi:hypothetical protein
MEDHWFDDTFDLSRLEDIEDMFPEESGPTMQWRGLPYLLALFGWE